MHNLIDQQLGDYIILEEIASGGMGHVLRAVHTGTGEMAAIKVASSTFASNPEYRKRFTREASTAHRLEHPNILRVLDFGEANGSLFMVMPYVRGGSLGAYLQHGGVLAPIQTGDILRQIASALDYAHSEGVVHRDIKPHNIMMGGGGQTLLTDFGLVKLTDASQFTASDMVLGSPAYMSPEQGQGKPLDWRTDLYSLGVVIYECLLGGLPFRAESMAGMITHHIFSKPLEPRSINPNFPESLSLVLLHALEKPPEARYQSGREFNAAFAEAVSTLNEMTRLGPLVTPEQITESGALNNESLPVDSFQIGGSQRVTMPFPAPEPAPARRRVWPFLLALAGIILALVLGTRYVVTPLREQIVSLQGTANAFRTQTPIVITSVVTQIVTNEAGEIVIIEVTRIGTAEPGSSPVPPATRTPSPSPSPSPTPAPSATPVPPSPLPPSPLPPSATSVPPTRTLIPPTPRPTATLPPPPTLTVPPLPTPTPDSTILDPLPTIDPGEIIPTVDTGGLLPTVDVGGLLPTLDLGGLLPY